MNRRLTLKSERLAELTSVELAGVVAGQELSIRACETSFTCRTGYYMTIDAPCPSVNECIEIRQSLLCPTTR